MCLQFLKNIFKIGHSHNTNKSNSPVIPIDQNIESELKVNNNKQQTNLKLETVNEEGFFFVYAEDCQISPEESAELNDISTTAEFAKFLYQNNYTTFDTGMICKLHTIDSMTDIYNGVLFYNPKQKEAFIYAQSCDDKHGLLFVEVSDSYEVTKYTIIEEN